MTTVTVDDQGYITDIDGDLPEDAPKALAVREPERLEVTKTPEAMVGMATRMATVLADIVEKRGLFTTIRGKKYPHVEAWMTIARMDNVVCREVPDGIVALEDGSYEATVELIRLSDGLVIGRGSAICGAPNDGEWTTRAAHMKRSMAVTRATSRAFRQQYSWIMALAGYEPTPSDEMPGNDTSNPPPKQVGEFEEIVGEEIRAGTVKATPSHNLEVRTTPKGPAFSFTLDTGEGGRIVIVEGDLAAAIIAVEEDPKKLVKHWCRVKGRVYKVSEEGRRSFLRLRALGFETREYVLPAPDQPAAVPQQTGPGLFDADLEAELDAAVPS